MNCAVHADAASTGFCSQCGKAMCEACARDVRGVLFCEECLAARVTAPPAPPPGTPSPGVALMLGFIPGVGAIYNGEYLKGLIHIMIFFGLIGIADSVHHEPFEAMLVMLAVGFYFYMVIEAYQTAKRRAIGQAAAPASGWSFPGTSPATVAPIGPIVLIVLGVVFLARTMDLFDFYYFQFLWRFWPLILIAIGAWMLWRRTAGPPPPAGGSGSPQ
ncbi:MAG: LiaI-LiaF-like domain-containing protein [Candidatus Acidiferrales bacterium]